MTAVEWLYQTWGNYPDLWTWEKIQEWFEEAKQMEKNQIYEAYSDGLGNGRSIGEGLVKMEWVANKEEYYNEIYGK